MTLGRRQLRVRVLEALERRTRQFRSREELWPVRVPREPLALDEVIEQALPDDHRDFDPDHPAIPHAAPPGVGPRRTAPARRSRVGCVGDRAAIGPEDVLRLRRRRDAHPGLRRAQRRGRNRSAVPPAPVRVGRPALRDRDVRRRADARPILDRGSRVSRRHVRQPVRDDARGGFRPPGARGARAANATTATRAAATSARMSSAGSDTCSGSTRRAYPVAFRLEAEATVVVDALEKWRTCGGCGRRAIVDGPGSSILGVGLRRAGCRGCGARVRSEAITAKNITMRRIPRAAPTVRVISYTSKGNTPWSATGVPAG